MSQARYETDLYVDGVYDLYDARDNDRRLLEEVGDCSAHGHDTFTANFDRQFSHVVSHAQLHLPITSTTQASRVPPRKTGPMLRFT